ncbi:unnamed protein product [Discula destructiva]
MASNGDAFTGKTMTVHLANPPSTVTGRVESIIPGQGLVLIVWDAAQQRSIRREIPSNNISDVKVLQVQPPPPAPAPAPAPASEHATRPALTPQQMDRFRFEQEQQQHRVWDRSQAQTNKQQHQHHQHHQQPQQPQQPAAMFQAYQNQNIQSPMGSLPPINHQPHSQQTQPIHTPMAQGNYSHAPQFAPQHMPHNLQQPQQPQHPQAAFVDPAILSMGKPPVRASQPTAAPSPLPAAVITSPATAQQHFSHQAFAQQTNGSAQASIPNIEIGNSQIQETPQHVLVETMESLTVRPELADESVGTAPVADGAEREEQENHESQRKRGGRRNRPRKGANDTLDGEVSFAKATRPEKKEQGKGWRETPILEDTAAFQPYKALRRTKATQDGWQSEDVTDVQEAGEFDFESSLKKFDKRTIFGEMQQKDKVDESDRLVSHNRIQRPKPGTAGGKNLHYTDNVLDVPANLEKPTKTLPDDFWKSEADDGARNGSERLSGRELGSRQSSRRGEGKAAAVKGRSQSRKTSAADVGQAPIRTNSGLPSGPISSAGFIIPGTSKRIEILSPLQMLNLENIAQNDLGLTEDMMTENAARGIAEVALHTLTDPAIRVRLAAVDGSAPEPATVVIMAGNNKSGYRSVAAGRHLRNKGMNVILCVVGIEKGERDLSVDMTKQLRLFKNFGGKVLSKGELFEFVRKASIPVISMDAPRSVLPQAPPMAVTLIVDALLGHVTPFEDLRAADQATVYELIEWTNRNEAFVLAVDVPTGIDHTNGSLTVQDGNSLYIRPRYVVSIGAPKKGLYEVIAAGAVDDDEDDNATATGRVSDDTVQDWNLFLIDIGLGAAVWKRAGTKIRRGIDFGNRWALQFKYQSSSAADQVGEE